MLEDLKSHERIYKKREQYVSLKVFQLRAALGMELPADPVVFLFFPLARVYCRVSCARQDFFHIVNNKLYSFFYTVNYYSF